MVYDIILLYFLLPYISYHFNSILSLALILKNTQEDLGFHLFGWFGSVFCLPGNHSLFYTSLKNPLKKYLLCVYISCIILLIKKFIHSER